MSAPHEQDVPALRSGGFWIPGDAHPTDHGTFSRGSMWVEWLAPAGEAHGLPVVLVHGGGGQGTDWLVTPDGRPGWAPRFAAAGRAVYVVDRPGHGRSPHDPAVLGAPSGTMPNEGLVGLFATPELADGHTRWPWSRAIDGPEIAQIAASSGFFLADFAESQRLDGVRLAELLDLLGPSIVVTHSAGAPAGWLAASLSENVVAILAVEPLGPPYRELPGLGALTHGLTAAPLGPRGLGGATVRVLIGSASPIAPAGAPVTEFLRAAGADAELVELAALGIDGNGHGLIFEENSDETAEAALRLIAPFG